MVKLKERQFYAVQIRKAITIPADKIKIKDFQNRKTGKVTMMVGYSDRYDIEVFKIISPSKRERMMKKYN